jgi:head-tail adaptor
MSFQNLLNQKCKIERGTFTKDARGNKNKSWELVKEDAKCRINAQSINSSDLSQGQSGQELSNKYIGFFLKSQDIKRGDRVTWYDTVLYVKDVPKVFGMTTFHHIEVSLELHEG